MTNEAVFTYGSSSRDLPSFNAQQTPSSFNTCKEIPCKRHPNADLIIAIANGAQGQLIRGRCGKLWFDETADVCLNAIAGGLQSVRSRPALKLIDWSKIPVGAMTSKGRIVANNLKVKKLSIIDKNDIITFFGNNAVRNLHLVEQTDFTYWPGGECPVPEGVLFEVIFRDGDNRFIDNYSPATALRWNHTGSYGDIIAYRITGLADGYTDNPSEVA